VACSQTLKKGNKAMKGSYKKSILNVLILLALAFSALRVSPAHAAADWETVGAAGFSAGLAHDLSLALDGDTPFVAYQDWANGNKTTVMKFDGTEWVNVGAAGFSAGGATYQSLALDDAGTPFVVYEDGTNGGKTTLMKYSSVVSDTTAPVLESFTLLNPATSPTDADSLVFRATFSEDVQNVDTADFAVNGTTTATVTDVSVVDASSYAVTVSGGDLAGFNGTVGLDLDAAQDIQDLAGNSLPAGEPVTDETYEVVNLGAAPVAEADAYNAIMSTLLNGSSVLANDSDADSDPLTASLVDGPAHAIAFTFNVNGTFAYTPVNGYQGTDTFTYAANDGALDSNTATVTITITPRSKTFTSTGSYDGWICESSESSKVGGTIARDYALRLGDHARDQQDRVLIHFATSGLPDNAVITKVTLRLKKINTAGSDPFLWGGNLLVDMKTGFFDSASALQVSDFQAAATRSNVGVGNFTTSGGNWYRIKLKPVGLANVNRTGPTQFRLRFAVDDNNNNIIDYIRFYAGNATQAGNRPTLIVEYYVPLP
jgi:hypothetical protein